MGNVLAFQYVRPADNPKKPGDLRFFRWMGVGRWLLLNLPHLFAGEGYAGPPTLLLSGTSWAVDSASYHIQAPVHGILRAPAHEIAAIEQSTFRFLPLYDDNYRPITVSGMRGGRRPQALKALIHQLAVPGHLSGISLFEQTRNQLPEGRRKLLVLVGSYEEALHGAAYLRELRPDWRGQVTHLVPDDDEFENQWRAPAGLQRGLVAQFGTGNAWILVAPLLAVERGHTILNERDEAALGAASFLVRPHPRPDDLSYAIHAINRWAIDHYADQRWFAQQCGPETPSRIHMADVFRAAAAARWRKLLRRPMVYST